MTEFAPVNQCNTIRFDEATGLFDDNCFVSDRERQSADTSDYTVQNFRNESACGRDVTSLAMCHPNLRFKNGYGNLSACNVDSDSSVRMGSKYTNPRYRQQLFTRISHGGPNMSRGAVNPDEESNLIQSESSRLNKACNVLSGATTYEFAPLLPCVKSVQDVQHVVQPWVITDTRAWIRDNDYDKRCSLS